MSANAEEWTLKQAVQQAVLKNPEVLSRWDGFKAATHNIDAVKGGYKPTVDLTADIYKERQKSPYTNNTWDSYNRSDASLVLDQILFDGGFTRNQVDKFSYIQRVRYEELLDATETTALEAMKAYMDVVRYRKLHDYAVENYLHHRKVFDQIQARVKSGVGRLVDLEQASGRLALAESNLLTQDSNLHDVSARYQRVVGTLPPEQMAEPPDLATGIPDTSIKALHEAYAQNPSLLAAQENIVATESDAKIRRARYYPRIDLQAKKTLSHTGINAIGLHGNTDTEDIGLVLNYNLYNGGADRATEKQYWELVNVAKDDRDKKCRDVRQTLLIAYNDVRQLKEQMGYKEQHMLSQEKATAAYYKQFDIGQRTLLDLLDAENEMFQAKMDYTNASYDYDYAKARTHAAMGDLTGALGVKQLNADGLAKQDRVAAFDPDTSCPYEEAPQIVIDKDKLYADSLPAAAPAAPVAAAPVTTAPAPAPASAPAPIPAPVLSKGHPLVINDVNFEFDKATLRPGAKTLLNQAATDLKNQNYPDVLIDGYTDITGTIAYNLKLSKRRAESVKKYLVSQGVPENTMTTKGYGKTHFIATNKTKEGRAQNRRVEIHIR